ILRKDFIVDPYQVYETRALGADAFLIIVHLLSNTKLKELLKTADALKLDTLVEAHTKEELDRALEAGSKLIGINNRNLKTLKTDLTVSERLIPFIPKGVIAVVESGIETRTDIKRYQQLGINHFLIGTSLMKSKNIKQKIRELNGQLNGVQ
ncbi:MAG TPA: indole-3-glycerol phosphate synthase TrpC, partial [Candidatus Omnitrophota bacterium]|nr:indole-3-glycerol phosphate synthase TrpC [Candidatus Omnitrophota bacterium]